jgi:hypothetical protein
MVVVDFNSVGAILSKSKALHTMQVLVRETRFGFSSQKPVVFLISDRGLFFGGSSATKGEFEHVPFGDIIEFDFFGSSFWRCLRLVYELEGCERKLFLTPFLGHPHKPEIDDECMDRLNSLVFEYLGKQGVRL